MSSGKPTSDKAGSRDRRARLAEELRANLQRRKAQTRARRGSQADGGSEGQAAAAVAGGPGAPREPGE